MNPATNRLFVLFGVRSLAAQFATAQDCFSNPAPLTAFLNANFGNTNAGMVVGLLDEHGSRILSFGRF